jgi:nickel-dependent lactate racemase
MLTGVDSARTGTSIALPWGVWRQDVRQEWPLPASWTPVVCTNQQKVPLTPTAIDAAFDTPIGTERLETIVSGARSVAIAIDDITRPTPTAQLLPLVLNRLRAAGVPRPRITIAIASGAHRRATPDDVGLKVGPECADISVVPHDPTGDLMDTGQLLGGVPVRVNRAFMDAEIRIGICGVLPHPFAGFSGGAKIVVPGLADLDVLARTHKFALMGLRGGHQLQGNRFRSEMEGVVRAIGLHWTVNVAIDEQRRPVALACGDLVAAHRSAASAAEEAARTPSPDHPLDALVLNAYPKDGELLQLEAAFVALRSGMLRWLAPGAPVVLAGACLEGLGHHELFGPGGRLFRAPAAKTFLTDHPLVIFAPGVTSEECAAAFWDGYRHFALWPELVEYLNPRLARQPRVGIVPCAPLQLATEESHAA